MKAFKRGTFVLGLTEIGATFVVRALSNIPSSPFYFVKTIYFNVETIVCAKTYFFNFINLEFRFWAVQVNE